MANRGLAVALSYAEGQLALSTSTDGGRAGAAQGGVTSLRGDDEARASLLGRIRYLRSMTGSVCRHGKKERSYGDLVSLVDVANSPADFYIGYWNLKAFEELSGDTIPWEVIHRLAGGKLNSFRAMHQNEEHFADRALVAYDLWHRAAIDAASEGRLVAALLLNSFADHYLTDFHAPGHVRTPRRRLQDEIAFGIHNFYNKQGARFHPSPPHWWSDAIQDSGLIPLYAATCGASLPDRCLDSLRRNGITFYGDGKLDESPGEELFLTMLVASSVLDLIWAVPAAHDYRRGSFRPLSYRPATRVENKHYFAWRHASGGTAYGQFEPAKGRLLGPRSDRVFSITGAVQHFSNPRWPADERYQLGIDVSVMAKPGDWKLRDAAPNNGELPPHRLLWRNLTQTQVILALGADAVGDPGGAPHRLAPFMGAGPYGRISVPIPPINAKLNGTLGRRYYPHADAEGASQWGWHKGGGVEFGFGILFLGLNLGWEQYVNYDARRLENARVLSPSLTFVLPSTVHFP